MKLFTRNKRGSLSLSMEAIVILILAVVMLGLGLTFVRGMFANITESATAALGDAQLNTNPSEGEPVDFIPRNPDIKAGDTDTVEVGFYNPDTSANNWILEVDDGNGVCGGLDGSECHNLMIDTLYNTNPFVLEKDDVVGFNIVFSPVDGATDGGPSKPYLFTIRFCGSSLSPPSSCEDADRVYQRELFMTVRA